MVLEKTKITNHKGERDAVTAISQETDASLSAMSAVPRSAKVSGGAQANLSVVLSELSAVCRQLMDLHKDISLQELNTLVNKNEDGSIGGVLIGIRDAIIGAANAQGNATLIQGWQSIAGGLVSGLGAAYTAGVPHILGEKFSKEFKSAETKLAEANKAVNQLEQMDKAVMNDPKQNAQQIEVNNNNENLNNRALFSDKNGFNAQGEIKGDFAQKVHEAGKTPEFKQELQTRLQKAQSEASAHANEISQRPMKANMVTSSITSMGSGVSSYFVSEKQKEQGEQQAQSEVLRSASNLIMEAEQDAKQKSNDSLSAAMQYIQGTISAMMSLAANV